MRKLKRYVMILALVPALFITSCKKDMPEVVAVDYFSVLTDYMENNNLDLSDMLVGWVIPATSVVDVANGFTVPDYHVFDIRSTTDYEAGHIDGAINVALADVVTAAANYTGKPILVVCKTGQTAGHAVMALRLSGYTDAKVLKWGMAGWNPDFAAPWEANSGHTNGNVASGNANWVTTGAPSLGSFANPTWSTTATDGAGILAERVEALLNGGFKATSSDPVLATPANYQIMNYWGATDYAAYGHFDGAFQISPINLANVSAFDPAAESLVYCYTGQTSSMAVAWLNVLGVNAKSILYGANRLNYDGLSADSKPTYHGAENYGYKTGTGTSVVNHYNILKAYMESNDLDLTDILVSWVIPAASVVDVSDYSVPNYHVFDIRSAAAYDAGHIKGAINVALADVVTTAANYTDKPILVVCVTGQTAGHAVMALRLSGYADAKVLKWGMAGWNPAFDAAWQSNSGHTNGNVASGNANWVTTAAPALGTFSNPTWTATANDGAGILAERVTALLTGGFKATSSDPVMATPANYQIMNYWSATDYAAYGHFAGAHQILPISFDNVNAFDPATESLVYCYTGQTSSMAVAWLNVLGYNTKSILFGANRLNYDGLSTDSKPTYHGAESYSYVTTP